MYILTFLLILFVVFLPQLFYWRYLSGHFVYYSYPGENFANWKNPRVLSAWFAPLNGAFLYIPLLLFFVAGFIIMIRNKITNGIFIGLFFLLISYIFPSWHSWYFGGSFGYRSFVEYYALFALPFAYSLGFLGNLKNLYVRSILIFLILASSYYTMRLTYYQRWNTSSTWAWDDYLRYLDEVGIYNYPGNSYTFITDFDNADNTDLFRTRKCFHSPTQGGIVTKNIEYNVIFKRSLHILLKKPVQRVRASIWVNPGNKIKTGILLTILIENWEHKCYFFKAIKVDDFLKIPDKWAEVTGSIEIPEWIDQSNNFVFQVWNPARSDNVYIDDVKLRFE
jgi:hypothetical protein